jgi:hypothetical protein
VIITVMMMMMIGHEPKRDTLCGENQQQGGEGRKRVLGD